LLMACRGSWCKEKIIAKYTKYIYEVSTCPAKSITTYMSQPDTGIQCDA